MCECTNPAPFFEFHDYSILLVGQHQGQSITMTRDTHPTGDKAIAANEGTRVLSTHPLKHSTVLLAAFVGCFCLVFAVITLCLIVTSSPKGIVGVVIACVVFLGFGLGAIWCFRIVSRSQRYTVYLGAEGLRISDRGSWIDWGQISRLQCSTPEQRLDLQDSRGASLGAIAYQISSFDVVLNALLENVVISAAPATGSGWGKPSALRFWVGSGVPLLAIVLLGVWSWIKGSPVVGTLFPLVTLVSFIREAWKSLRYIEISPNGLVLKTAVRTWRIRHGDVRSVDLVVSPVEDITKRLDVTIEQQNGRAQSVLPATANAIDVYAAVRAWWLNQCQD